MQQNSLSLLAYQTIENPEKRNDFLAAFAEIIGAKAAAIVVADQQLRWARLPLTHGMDRATIDSYTQYYFGLNPWALHRPKVAGGVSSGDFETLSEKEFRDTEYYQGWYKPRGWLHAFSITLRATETECAWIFAIRPSGHPWTEKEMAIVKDLAPHLTLAAQITKRQMALQNTINRLRGGLGQSDAIQRFNLSPREFTIASAVARGQILKEIAFKTGLTLGTVRWYMKNIHKKLGVNRQSELVRVFLDNSKN